MRPELNLLYVRLIQVKAYDPTFKNEEDDAGY